MFPAPSVTPPTFSQFPSAYFNGISFGPAPFFITSGGIEGVAGMPDVRSGDTDAPRVHGQFIGEDLLGGRDITLTIDVGPPFGSYGTLAGAMAALRAALTPTGTTENPFFVQLPAGSSALGVGGVMYAAMARPRKRPVKIDLAYTVGQLARAVPIQWHATDPTLYAAGTQQPTVGIAPPLPGFSFPMTFPLSFGGGTAVSLINAANVGDLPCYPVFVFTGPATSPTVTDISLAGNPFLQFSVGMQAGDVMVVTTDPKNRSCLYYTAGSTSGSSRLYTLAQASTWFALQPGLNQIQFSTLDTSYVAGTCSMEWTSAYSAAA